MFGNLGRRTSRVAPLAVRADGMVIQLPPEAVTAWPIRYIMTIEADPRPLGTALAARFSTMLGGRR